MAEPGFHKGVYDPKPALASAGRPLPISSLNFQELGWSGGVMGDEVITGEKTEAQGVICLIGEEI